MKKKLLTNTYLREADKYQIRLFLDEEDVYISVKKLIHVTKPFIIHHNITGMDSGYYILEVVPKKGHVAMRVFLNEKKEIVEYYFDIIKESGMDEKYKVPFFYDLYLDVTLLPNGEISIIDEQELEEALKSGDITEQDYRMIIKEKNKLIKEIKEKKNSLINRDYSSYYRGM